MSFTSTAARCTAASTLARAVAWPLAVSSVLVDQPPASAANVVANGTDGQTGHFAEFFNFAGSAHAMAWWGTTLSLREAGWDGPARTLLTSLRLKPGAIRR